MILQKIAKAQRKYAIPIILITIVITIILGYGIKNISLQTDMSKEMPQDLPIYVLNNKISDSFGGQDTVLLLFKLDDELDKTEIKDIRHPYIIQSLVMIESLLKEESIINEINSPAKYFKGKYYPTLEYTKKIIEKTGSEMFFSPDYKSVIMYIKADIGSSEEQIIKLKNLIQEDIDSAPQIPGLKITITGTPPIRAIISKFLAEDAIFTLVLAGAIILLLLFIIERSFTKGILIFAPLTIGLIWTLGTMGWLKIPLSIATVGLGAMILGLGVEYGVFMVTRYKEERKKGKNQENSLLTAVPAVGSAILGSGSTTIVGFLALTLSTLPMMQKLGLSLALGITFTLLSAVLISPAIIILEENFENWFINRQITRLNVKYTKLKQR